MNELTFFELILAIIVFPLTLFNLLITEALGFIFFDLLNLGAGATAMIM